MRRESVFLAVLLVLCYSIYGVGGLLVGFDDPASGSGALGEVPNETPSIQDSNESSLTFQNVSAASGLNYTAASSEKLYGAQTMVSDSGVYVTDFNRDGWRDVLLIGGEKPVLYENQNGEFRPSEALPETKGSVRAALFFDHNGDGREDLLLLRTGLTPVFFENTGGDFKRVNTGFDDTLNVPIGASTGDVTGNGCLDVIVIQNGDWVTDRPLGLSDSNRSQSEDNGNPNYLYEGDCSKFDRTDVKIGGDHWSLATSVVDLTGDGTPDIHVANDYNHDVVYRNHGNGTFERDVMGEFTDRNGMSSEVADITGNGRLDVFTTNIWFPDWVNERMSRTVAIRAQGNNLLLNRDHGTFVDGGDTYGLHRGGWGWAAVIDDFDNDLQRDVFHTTRLMSFDFSDQRFSDQDIREIRMEHEFYQYPALFERTNDGFVQRSADAAGFDSTDGRGVATLDYNRDGRLDLLVADASGTFRLYKNQADAGSALRVDVRDGNGSTALGAEVTVTATNRTQFDVITSNTDFLSQGSRVLHFGTGPADTATLTVTWPDGTERTFADVETNQQVIITPEGIQNRTAF